MSINQNIFDQQPEIIKFFKAVEKAIDLCRKFLIKNLFQVSTKFKIDEIIMKFCYFGRWQLGQAISFIKMLTEKYDVG